MTHVFTLSPFIYIAHVSHMSTTITITSGAYYLPNSLHSSVRKYTSVCKPPYSIYYVNIRLFRKAIANLPIGGQWWNMSSCLLVRFLASICHPLYAWKPFKCKQKLYQTCDYANQFMWVYHSSANHSMWVCFEVLTISH